MGEADPLASAFHQRANCSLLRVARLNISSTGIAGGELLKDAKDVGATLPQMQERAAECLDEKT